MLPGIAILKIAGPPTEPGNPETAKVHFEVRKKATLDPPEKNGPRSLLNVQKWPSSHILMDLLNILIDFLGPFSQKAQRSKKFNLARNFQCRSKFLNVARNFLSQRLDFLTKKGRGGWLAHKFHSRSKFSISLEISNFFDLWALWVLGGGSRMALLGL